MNNHTPLFIPMAPLRYLIMSKSEKTLMGIYTHAPSGATVLKAWLHALPGYCWPTNNQLADLLENRIEVHQALSKMRKTKEDLTPLTGNEAFRFDLRCYLDMRDTIMELEDVLVHPNFYDIFQGHLNLNQKKF
jgi:hypothetical protein